MPNCTCKHLNTSKLPFTVTSGAMLITWAGTCWAPEFTKFAGGSSKKRERRVSGHRRRLSHHVTLNLVTVPAGPQALISLFFKNEETNTQRHAATH